MKKLARNSAGKAACYVCWWELDPDEMKKPMAERQWITTPWFPNEATKPGTRITTLPLLAVANTFQQAITMVQLPKGERNSKKAYKEQRWSSITGIASWEARTSKWMKSRNYIIRPDGKQWCHLLLRNAKGRNERMTNKLLARDSVRDMFFKLCSQE